MNFRQLLIFPPLIVAVALFYWMTSRTDAPKPANPEVAVAARTMVVEKRPFTPTAVGFGRLQAERSWQAISQVNGRVTQLHDKIAIGAVVGAGEVLISIDPRDYEIAKAKSQANLDSALAQVNELAAQEVNTGASLELEQQIAASQQIDFNRKQKLVDSGTNSPATLDQARRDLLNQQKKVLDLENTLNLYPVQKVTLDATIATRRAELEEAERNLANTLIRAPFTGRITQKSIAEGQYTRSGDSLITIEAIDRSEVVGEFQPSSVGEMIRFLINGDGVSDLLRGQDREAIINVFQSLGLKARVRSDLRRADNGEQFTWPAEITRISGRVDDTTGTAGIVVTINNSGVPDPDLQRPPLPNGAFVEVELSAPEAISRLIVPRSALHQTDTGIFVYVVDADSRLARRDVGIGPTVNDQTLIESGLSEGDTLVISSPQPAILGMLLAPVTAPPEQSAE